MYHYSWCGRSPCEQQNWGAYRNYANLDLSFYNEIYYMENLQQLMKILDPEDLFSCSQCIMSVMTLSVWPISQLIWHYLPYAFVSVTSTAMIFIYGCTKDNKCGNTQDLIKCVQIPTDCGDEPFCMNSGYQREPLSDVGIQTIIDHILAIENITGCINTVTLGGKSPEGN